MSDGWQRIGRLFLRPALPTAASVVPAGDRSATAIVLAPPADAVTSGAAVGLALLGAGSRASATVATWTGAEAAATGMAVPAVASARRSAAALERRGLAARPTGRLVHVALPAHEDEAALTAERAVATAVGPVVVVVAAPRTTAFDGLLAAGDVVVVATSGAEPGIADLAVRSLAASRAVVCCALAPDAAAALLARSGAVLMPSLRAALRPVLEAVS